MDFKDARSKILESQTVKEEYEKLIPEYQIIRENISSRKEKQYFTDSAHLEAYPDSV